MTPLDGGPQRLLAHRHVASPAGEDAELAVEPVQQLLQAEAPRSGGRKLDRQWDPLHPSAYRTDDVQVFRSEISCGAHCLSSVQEELHGLRLSTRGTPALLGNAQWPYVDHPFDRQPEPLAARHQHFRRWSLAHELTEQGRGR